MRGDAENPPFEDESFDLILCRHLTWTLTDLKKALTIWKRRLKPQGILAVIDGIWGATTVRARLCKGVADALRAVKQKKWPKDWRRSYVSDVKALPYIDGLRPQPLMETLAACGFENIRHDPLREIVQHERRFAPLEYNIRQKPLRSVLPGAPRHWMCKKKAFCGCACGRPVHFQPIELRRPMRGLFYGHCTPFYRFGG